MLTRNTPDGCRKTPTPSSALGRGSSRSRAFGRCSIWGGALLAAMSIGCGKVSTDDGAHAAQGGSGGIAHAGGKDAAGGTGGTVSASGGTVGASGGASSGGASSAVDWTSCDKTAQCTLIPSGCCESCGDAPLSSYRAIHLAYRDAAREQACAGNEACPACVATFNPSYFAVCESGHCTARDLTTSEASACETDGDCSLAPPKCCQNIGPNDPPPHAVAINTSQSQDYYQSLCAGVEASGPPCEWMEPPGLEAKCDQGRCAVVGE